MQIKSRVLNGAQDGGGTVDSPLADLWMDGGGKDFGQVLNYCDLQWGPKV